MNACQYRNGALFIEEAAVRELARQYGTPLYVYSRGHLESQFRALTEALHDIKPLICFAVKANTNGAVIQTFARLGAGADVVSGGELFRAQRAGVAADKIVYAGVGKTVREIEYALACGIAYFTVESEPELERISACARKAGRPARVAVRVNPDVDPKTHKHTSTGKKESKFGVDIERALAAYELAARLPDLEIAGIHMHLGSPLMTVAPYVQALEKIAPVCAALRQKYASFQILDLGGGQGIAYRDTDRPPTPAEFAAAVLPHLKRIGLRVTLEPGRFLVGNAGFLVTEVQYLKDNPFKKFIVVDAAMNDLIRPALYDAYHGILSERETAETIRGDVVGPVCESGDFLAQDRDLPVARAGDLLVVRSAGAYGFAMSSNYNSRGRAAEVMIAGARHQLIRDRETWEDLVRGERFWDD